MKIRLAVHDTQRGHFFVKVLEWSSLFGDRPIDKGQVMYIKPIVEDTSINAVYVVDIGRGEDGSYLVFLDSQGWLDWSSPLPGGGGYDIDRNRLHDYGFIQSNDLY